MDRSSKIFASRCSRYPLNACTTDFQVFEKIGYPNTARCDGLDMARPGKPLAFAARQAHVDGVDEAREGSDLLPGPWAPHLCRAVRHRV